METKTICMTLEGAMPSKKNGWKRATSGKVYIPSDMQRELDAFLWQLKPHRPKTPIEGPIELDVVFFGQSRLDLDNMLTTLQDLLQKSGIIKNDKDVFKLSAQRMAATTPTLSVDITYHAS